MTRFKNLNNEDIEGKMTNIDVCPLCEKKDTCKEYQKWMKDIKRICNQEEKGK